MALRVVTAPTGTLISLDDAKAQLRVDHDDEDDLIAALILAAQNQIEALTQRRYLPQTIEWVCDSWCDRMVLPIAPGSDCSKIAIASVKYTDLQSEQQTLDPATMYWSRPAGPTLAIARQWFAVWPWLGDGAERVVVRISITSEAEDAPDAVKHAMRLLISHWYRNRDAVVGVDNRDSSTAMPFGVEELLVGERWEIT